MREFGDFTSEYTNYDASKVVILPIPFDATSTWIKGADKGPQAILDASFNLEFYDIETNFEAFTVGIHTSKPINEKENAEKMVEEVYKRTVKYINDDKFSCAWWRTFSEYWII